MSDRHISTSNASFSEKFNSLDADITFRSCDDILFKIHRKNLEVCTGGFPPSGFDTLGEIVPLTESASTLEILFQYMYPVPQPDIRSFPFVTMAAVAEAAEKYQVYPAIYICTIIMETILPENAHPVLIHAGRHSHKSLLAKAAPYIIGTPLDEIISELPRNIIIPWTTLPAIKQIKYHMAWEHVLQEARAYPGRNGFYRPQDLMSYLIKLNNVVALKDLGTVFGDIINSADADIVFKSCDDTLFKIHRKNLEVCTGGFPPSGFDTLGEIVPLTESSSTLELLFQYIYPMPQPDIRSFSIEVISAVAEAAEKYRVYPAIFNCMLIMEIMLPENAHQIFFHAGRHGHKPLLGKAAPFIIGTPLDEIVSELPVNLVVPWIKYNMTWDEELRKARVYPHNNPLYGFSNIRDRYPQDIMNHITKLEDVTVLKDLTKVFGEIAKADTNPLPSYLRLWQNAIKSNVQEIKSFDKYLEP
ncbi:hypothetical protein BDZ94DRAFT_1325461 [Collybia nuda]|uniref:BTB domain-containing protein n=1 Tax=Collybia nuda TaxID=64659 RepID=A0A9P6CDV0_9AGAR|nr:hypothetical protein BDZ94DRAFT_1325461 [Collybia nuda]